MKERSINDEINAIVEHEKFNIYVNGRLEVTTDDESEVQPYLDTIPETSTYAVRDIRGVVIEKYAK